MFTPPHTHTHTPIRTHPEGEFALTITVIGDGIDDTNLNI